MTLLHMALVRANIGAFVLSPDCRADKVVQVLLEFGARACVGTMVTAAGARAPVTFLATQALHSGVTDNCSMHMADVLLGTPEHWFTDYVKGEPAFLMLREVIAVVDTVGKGSTGAQAKLCADISARVSALSRRIEGSESASTGAGAMHGTGKT